MSNLIKTKIMCKFCNKDIDDWLTHSCPMRDDKIWGKRMRRDSNIRARALKSNQKIERRK